MPTDQSLLLYTGMHLAAQVTDYYFAHIEALSPAKQFHLASRLSAWTGDPRAAALLAACKPAIVPEPLSDNALSDTFKSLLYMHPSEQDHIPAFAERQPYFKKYTPLYGLELALFRLRHLETVYGIDGRAAFKAALDMAELTSLERRLLKDASALRTLSTYAVNYIYLLRRCLLQDAANIPVDIFYKLGKAYDTTDDEQLRLFVYLFTHCIIAESNFYDHALPGENLPIYTKMLQTLEPLISSHIATLSLDAKLEFLVCCQLVGYKTSLQPTIHAECQHSLSREGTFIVDAHNAYASNPHKKTFEASEHRNVLFVMSASPYKLAK